MNPFMDANEETPTCVKDKGAIHGVEIQGFYDGVAYWQCQKCAQVWGRDGRPHATSRTIPHPVMRTFTIGEFIDREAVRTLANANKP